MCETSLLILTILLVSAGPGTAQPPGFGLPAELVSRVDALDQSNIKGFNEIMQQAIIDKLIKSTHVEVDAVDSQTNGNYYCSSKGLVETESVGCARGVCINPLEGMYVNFISLKFGVKITYDKVVKGTPTQTVDIGKVVFEFPIIPGLEVKLRTTIPIDKSNNDRFKCLVTILSINFQFVTRFDRIFPFIASNHLFQLKIAADFWGGVESKMAPLVPRLVEKKIVHDISGEEPSWICVSDVLKQEVNGKVDLQSLSFPDKYTQYFH